MSPLLQWTEQADYVRSLVFAPHTIYNLITIEARGDLGSLNSLTYTPDSTWRSNNRFAAG